jgi:beta-glucanase (GH16 family)
MANVTFNDDFNTLSLYNGTSGVWSTTYNFSPLNGNGSSIPSNGEQEWYVNSNYAATSSVQPWNVNNGILTITAAPVSDSVKPYLGYTDSGLPQLGSYNYTSGLIQNSHVFAQTYGYFEMKAELPAGQGAWPAFWLLPNDGSWPPEIDVMEVLGNTPSTLYTTVHTNQTGTHTSSGIGSVVANTATGYHTYAVDWEKDYVTWYFDNKEVFKVATPADLNKPMYLIANLAVGGYWPGNADSTTHFPLNMEIDYIRAWDSNPYTQPTTTPTGPDQTFTVNQSGGDTFTLGGGTDKVIYPFVPWTPEHIIGFTPGVDKLDVSALLAKSNYTGTDPVADGYIKFINDNQGNTIVYYDSDGKGSVDQWGNNIAFMEGTLYYKMDGTSLITGTATTPPVVTPPVVVPPTTTTTNDIIYGTKHDDIIDGHGGRDTVYGSGGSDEFVFNKGYGYLLVEDYNRKDELDLSGFGTERPTVTHIPQGLALDFSDGDSITLIGVFDMKNVHIIYH